MSLRQRILLTTSALVVGIVVCMLAALSFIMSRQVVTSAHEVSQRSTAVLAYAIGAYQQRLATDTTLLAERPGTNSVYQADRATISDHLNELTRSIEADWMVMTDPAGDVIGASSAADPWLKKHADALRNVVRTSGDKPWKGTIATNDLAALAASQPIVTGDYVQAVLITGVNIDDGFLQQISRASTSEVAIIGPGGILASTVSPESELPSSEIAETVTIHGNEYVGLREDVPGVSEGEHLQLVTLVPEDFVTGPFQPVQRALYFSLGLGLLSAVAVGAWLAYDVTRPLDALFRAAKTIKEGGWPESFGAERKDEIGSLQGMFDEMSSSLQSSRQKLIGMLEIDPLTELANYRSFREKFDHLLAEWEQEGGTLGLVMIDLDRFEIFNQVRGVAVGDQVLLHLASILRIEAGDDALCARYAGGVLVVALTNAQQVRNVSEGVRRRAESELGITVSIGICFAGVDTRRSDLVLLAAELATSQAKAGGRNRIREFSGFEFSGDEHDLRLFLQQGSYSAVRALAEAVDAKDEYTRGHSSRVAEYARSLATAGGLDEGFVELVYITGTLHDVGKIGIPDAALKKAGRLTEEEYAMIKTHPEIGEKIVSQIPQLRDTLPGIRCHHERWDGSGYPDRLAGKAIPLVARILSVVDTFDAMTSERPYRRGLAEEVALAEIERGAGTQFDAEWALRFVELRRSQSAMTVA